MLKLKFLAVKAHTDLLTVQVSGSLAAESNTAHSLQHEAQFFAIEKLGKIREEWTYHEEGRV